jgi:hypothetical protein
VSGVTACNKAIKAGYSGAQFAGPGVAWQPTWLSAYAQATGTSAKALSAHFYPLGCADDGTSDSHGGLNTLCDGYTVLCSTATNSNMYTPQPICYGLLFTRLFGIGAFLPVTVSTSSSDQHVVAFADKPPATPAGGAVHVLVEKTWARRPPRPPCSSPATPGPRCR